GDHLGRDRNGRQHPGQRAGGLRESRLLLQDVRLDGDDGSDAGRTGFGGGYGVHSSDYGLQRLSLPGMWHFGETELAALGLSLSVALRAVAINLLPAVLIAWLLTRRRFPGRMLLDAFVHLPLVLPPVVVGYLLLVLLGTR